MLTLILQVVPDFSSSLDDTRERAQHIPGNHMAMCRFAKRDDPGYAQVVREMKEIIDTIVTVSRVQKVQALLDQTCTSWSENRYYTES
jgi:hypothetical protein